MSPATLVIYTFTVQSAAGPVIRQLVAIGCMRTYIVLITKSKEILPLGIKADHQGRWHPRAMLR